MNKDREKFDEGMKALGRADFETAIDIFSDVVVENENHAEAWFNLEGWLSFKQAMRRKELKPGSGC